MTRRWIRTVTLPLFAFVGGLFAQLLTGQSADASPQTESPYFVMGQLGRIVAEIENEYVDPVDRRRLLEGAAKGMVAELDPHSSYFAGQDYTEFTQQTEGQFAGVGVEVDARAGVITVIAPIEGAPADRAGIKSGDKIIGIDGASVHDTAFDKLVRKMRGAPNTHVKVTIQRDGVKEPITFDLVREVVHVRSARGKMLKGGIAYLRINQFQSQTHEELLKVIAKLREGNQPINGVLLDLRANGGGLVDQAVGVADEFLSSGTIYTARHRGQVVEEVSAHAGGALNEVPIVILVNEWTASASELVGGALQDNRRALIVGVRSFGKGSVQSIIDLPGGDGMKLTTARYYTPSGHAIQADGLHPDITVAPSVAADGGIPIVREGDTEGALPGEGSHEQDAGVVVHYTTDGGALSDDDLIDVKKVPTDPSQGADPVLKVGYETLRDRLVGKGPIVK